MRYVFAPVSEQIVSLYMVVTVIALMNRRN